MNTELTITDSQETFTAKQLATLGLEHNHPGEIATFFHQVRRTGLDPFSNQIFLVTRNGKATIQMGIAGLRTLARRAADARGETYGYEPELWCGPSGDWQDVWLQPEPPAAAKVTITRAGQDFTAVALFSEYAATRRDGQLTKFWAEKPALMLAKCAEALALRKAFPVDLSGLYISEEMGDPVSRVAPQQSAVPEPEPFDVEAFRATVHDLLNAVGQPDFDEGELSRWASQGVTDRLDRLDTAAREKLIGFLQGKAVK